MNDDHKEQIKRNINPQDIALPPGYKIEVFEDNFTTPINLIFTDSGEMYIADAGITSGTGKVLKKINEGFKVIAEGFNPPLTGITYYKGNIYVAHRGVITMIEPDGKKQDILQGLPSFGDHYNNRVVFGNDNKMYFGQGTATNSGVVGVDNESWVRKHPFFHDYIGETLPVKGINFTTKNFLSKAKKDVEITGPYQPFGVKTVPGELVKRITRASGSILRANLDGSNLEMVVWGLRNPFRIKFNKKGILFSTNHGIDVRGSRPVANSPDEFHIILPGNWYGWPDYTGGLPVTHPRFKPEGRHQPSFILANHPKQLQKPIVNFSPHSAIMGFDFNYNPDFGKVGDVFMAEFGSEAPRTTGGKPLPKPGHRVSVIDLSLRKILPFAVNKSEYAASYDNGGGFERPIDAVFDKSGNLFIVDFGIQLENGHHGYAPNTGVIWKISKK